MIGRIAALAGLGLVVSIGAIAPAAAQGTVPCDVGTYSNASAQACTRCSAYTFSDTPGASSCKVRVVQTR